MQNIYYKDTHKRNYMPRLQVPRSFQEPVWRDGKSMGPWTSNRDLLSLLINSVFDEWRSHSMVNSLLDFKLPMNGKWDVCSEYIIKVKEENQTSLRERPPKPAQL